MSESYDGTSEQGQDQQSESSVFDFLYHDTDRINSFLSQFSDAGYLQNLIRRESTSDGKSHSTSCHGNVNLAVAKGGGDTRDGTHNEGRESFEKSYNPLWSNSLVLLDYLAERELIERDLEHACIGQFVLLSGFLEIMDVSIAKKFLESKTLKEVFLRTPIPGAKKTEKNRKTGRVSEHDVRNIALELLPQFPYTIQANMKGKYNCWSVLKGESMATTSEHLILKYGTSDVGVWNILGILDTKPSEPGEKTFEEKLAEINDKVQEAEEKQDARTGFRQLANLFSVTAKELLGRSDQQYGITPLMIFRQVSV
ncbi:MAG: hypothetical protein KJO08_06990 [Gammaproteobacteria bacterium]|nr:hypothetical protein [Gammaproteobacteria bacterium]NNJ84295.1 hypothetical protein [Gammaproteobacteria bacterium]